MSSQHLDVLLEATAQAATVLILTHNDPDPDAIASAVALRHLLVNLQHAHVKIAYRGIVGSTRTAGGHGSMAGGQVRLNSRDPEMLARQISQAVLAYFEISPEETSRSLLMGGG